MSSATTITIRYSTPTWTSTGDFGPSNVSKVSFKLKTKPGLKDDEIDYEKMAEDFLFEINMMGLEKIAAVLKCMKIEEHGQHEQE